MPEKTITGHEYSREKLVVTYSDDSSETFHDVTSDQHGAFVGKRNDKGEVIPCTPAEQAAFLVELKARKA